MRHGSHPGGGRRERLFDSGDMRLLVQQVLHEQPRHGYEVIRAIAERVGGDYQPSPGTIYPTLTLLEDLGLAQATDEQGRKRYALTEAGVAELEGQADAVQTLLCRLQHLRQRHAGHRPPELMRAMDNLKAALRVRIDRQGPDEALVQRMAEVIDQAAQTIERL